MSTLSALTSQGYIGEELRKKKNKVRGEFQFLLQSSKVTLLHTQELTTNLAPLWQRTYGTLLTVFNVDNFQKFLASLTSLSQPIHNTLLTAPNVRKSSSGDDILQGKSKERSKREINSPNMASLAVQPIAEVQLANDVLKQFHSTKLVEATEIKATVIKAKELEIVWGNDKRYWEYKMEDCMEVAKLKEVCWLDVKGKMAMNPSNFSFGEMYSASFLIKRAPDARNLNNIKLSLSFNDGMPPMEKVVDLSKIAPADKWVTVTISDFKFEFGGQGREMTVSLTNHDGCCKTGLTIAGVVVQRIPPIGQN